jgi:hypothetical protein
MTDREAALQAWRDMLQRWPATTLRPEIELNVVDTLTQLGRREEARRAAQTFLTHFPASPRAAEVRARLAGEAPGP